MTNKDIFKIWSPPNAKWTNWVRPVPFITINDKLKLYNNVDFNIHKINYITTTDKHIGIIVDLPDISSIKEGIALAKLGYRPIPIFNGTDEQTASIGNVDNTLIKVGLIKGALELKNITLDNNAPPAFLIDTNRLNRVKNNPYVFDNSWDVYTQDLPSAEYLLNNGIKNILIVSESIQKDLAKILYKYKKSSLNILFSNGYDSPKKIKIKKYKEEL